MPFALLLAMQAAGMVTDFLGTRHQAELMNMGMKVQQAGIEANVEQTRLEAEDASLQSMKALRQNLGTQMAVYAARGTSTSNGSAALNFNESLGNFMQDERLRKLNTLGRVSDLKGQGLISTLEGKANNYKLWQGWASRTLNRFPTSLSGWGGGNQGFGLTSIGS